MKYQITNFKISHEFRDELKNQINKKYHLNNEFEYFVQKESVDARDKNKIMLSYNFILDTPKKLSINNTSIKKYEASFEELKYPNLSLKNRPIIVGFGPAGIFASLYLTRCNAKPIIIERGGSMDERISSVLNFLKNKTLDENSNIQFGEGGAGTFSDGKLTTNAKDKLINFILTEFVKFGAPKEIMYESMPHIGTDYLRKVIKNMRVDMEKNGASFYFNCKLTNIVSTKDGILATCGDMKLLTNHLILGLGHSARDTFKMLYEKKINMEPKSFSMGVRIEHKREKINQIQYGRLAKALPQATYKLAVHLDKRSVYTFCMCPGGEVMASQSEKNSIVTNGMSYYKRDKENSNAALLVNVDPSDYYKDSVLDGMYYQEKYERLAYEISNDYRAPANLVKEFLNDEIATKARSVVPSYPHGVVFCDFKRCLPDFVVDSLKEGIVQFDKKMKGFNDPDAVLTGIETRSSSPIRILRDENKESNIKGIYPIGEGAGYAGGIMTAALDGLKTAISIALRECE